MDAGVPGLVIARLRAQLAAHHYLRDRLVRTGLDACHSLYATVGKAWPAEAATEPTTGRFGPGCRN